MSGVSANAIERLKDVHDTLVEAVWSPDDVAAYMADVAAVEELYEAASRLSDPTHQLTQLEWNGVMSRLRAAVARVESGQ